MKFIFVLLVVVIVVISTILIYNDHIHPRELVQSIS